MTSNEAASLLPTRRICWHLAPVLAPDLLAPHASQGAALLLLRVTGCAEVLAPRAASRAAVALKWETHFWALEAFAGHSFQNIVTSAASRVPLRGEGCASHLPMRSNEAASLLPTCRICWHLAPVLAPDLLAPRASQGATLLLLRASSCAKVLAPRAASRAGVAVHYFALKS
ncbi:hypothetical protein HAX54_052453 [Datura stramonium]|uniref:Uncharacterized protein n=1 Tax=Datura stramonium TaxID=4076 RepID=A0ABS8SZ00_DATST|nr:hypothetical protein [Datura stramonium]